MTIRLSFAWEGRSVFQGEAWERIDLSISDSTGARYTPLISSLSVPVQTTTRRVPMTLSLLRDVGSLPEWTTTVTWKVDRVMRMHLYAKHNCMQDPQSLTFVCPPLEEGTSYTLSVTCNDRFHLRTSLREDGIVNKTNALASVPSDPYMEYFDCRDLLAQIFADLLENASCAFMGAHSIPLTEASGCSPPAILLKYVNDLAPPHVKALMSVAKPVLGCTFFLNQVESWSPLEKNVAAMCLDMLGKVGLRRMMYFFLRECCPSKPHLADQIAEAAQAFAIQMLTTLAPQVTRGETKVATEMHRLWDFREYFFAVTAPVLLREVVAFQKKHPSLPHISIADLASGIEASCWCITNAICSGHTGAVIAQLRMQALEHALQLLGSQTEQKQGKGAHNFFIPASFFELVSQRSLFQLADYTMRSWIPERFARSLNEEINAFAQKFLFELLKQMEKTCLPPQTPSLKFTSKPAGKALAKR